MKNYREKLGNKLQIKTSQPIKEQEKKNLELNTLFNMGIKR